MCTRRARARGNALRADRCTRAPRHRSSSLRTVLMIHSGAECFPANPMLDAGIREALASRPDVPIDYFAEYLESDLFPGEQASLAFADYIRRKYQGRRIDVVIAMTDTALRFVLDHREELFPDAPIVFFGLVAPTRSPAAPAAASQESRTGIAYGETLKLALALHPSTQRVFVVAKGQDEQTIGSVRAELSALFAAGEPHVSQRGDRASSCCPPSRPSPPGSFILYIWHSQPDSGNRPVSGRRSRGSSPQAAPVPVYGTSDIYIGTGVVGGVVRRTHETGNRIGEMALRILTGTRASGHSD